MMTDASTTGASIVESAQHHWWRRRATMLLAGSIVAAAVAVNVGAPLGLLIAVSSIPWVLEGLRRRSGTVTLALLLLTWLMAMLVATMLTGAINAPMLLVVSIVGVIFGLVGITVARGRRPDRIARSRGMIWGGASVGGLAWIGVMSIAAVIPGGAQYAWVMLGDSANNVLFGREAIYRNGLAIGPEENPVPLPSAVLALGMAPGRSFVESSDLLQHDIAAFALTWGTLIALSCVAVGVLAATTARGSGASLRLSAVIAVGASLLPMSWFVTGYPIEFGFYNTHLAVLILAASMLVFLDAERRPAVALAAQAVAATLMLAVWSPLVLMPGLLAVVLVLRFPRDLASVRGVHGVVLLVALVQLVVYGLVIVLPGFLALSGFLLAPGGVFAFPRSMVLWFAGLTVISALGVFWGKSRLAWSGFSAVALASLVGLGVLLWITRDQENPWSYYPLKFSWLATVMLLVLLCGLLPAVALRITRHFGPAIRGLALTIASAAIVTFLIVAPSFGVGYTAKNPALRLVSGDVLGDGDVVAHRIFNLADPEQSSFLWRTNDPFENSINFWVMQMWSDSLDDNFDLRFAAYGNYDDEDPQELCRIVDLMGGGTVVYTADEELLDAGAESACQGSGIRLVDARSTAF